MSKIVKNNKTSGSLVINDTGITIPFGDQYVIPQQDYLMWAASSDIITNIGSGDAIINDGSNDLSISDGTDLIKGIFPTDINVSVTNNTTLDNNYNIALGNITGYSVKHVQGYNGAVSTTEESIWVYGGMIYHPTSAGVVNIVSTDVNDNISGTGARTITVDGLDSNYDEQIEVVELNGTTSVQTTNTFIRVNNTFVESVGNNGKNHGSITLSIDGGTLRCIPIGENYNCTSLYTVPANKTALITNIYYTGSSNSANKESNMSLIFREINKPEIYWQKIQLNANDFLFQPKIPISVNEKTDIEMRAIVTSSGTIAVSGGFSLILKNN